MGRLAPSSKPLLQRMSVNEVITEINRVHSIIDCYQKKKQYDRSLIYMVALDKFVIQEISKVDFTREEVVLIAKTRSYLCDPIFKSMTFMELSEYVKNEIKHIKEYEDMGNEENAFEGMELLKETIFTQFIWGELNGNECSRICKIIIDDDLI